MRKMNLFIFMLALLFWGCRYNAGNKNETDDSLEYYPPTPAELGKQEFRHYHRLLQNFFDTSLLKSGFNGAILIAKNGSPVYEKYSGLIDIRKKASINEYTSFHVASTSKTFTAIAILQLVQQGRISLQDSLQKFFPRFPYKGITVKMLLNHRSGLPNYLYFMSNFKWGMNEKGKWNHQYATNEDVLKMIIEKMPDPTGSPDTKFNYCNTNFVLLALIIEKITGKSYPDYLQQQIFGPLHMNHTYVFQLKDSLTATPSFTNNGTLWNFDFLDATYGDKNIYTTPRDLLKWDQALYSNFLINTSLLDSAFAPYSFEKPGIHNYGLGWRLQLLPNGKKIVYHFGKWHGSNAAFARLIDAKATIIIIGNRFNRIIYDAALLCYDFFGDYQQRKIETIEETESVSNKEQLIKETKGKKRK